MIEGEFPGFRPDLDLGWNAGSATSRNLPLWALNWSCSVQTESNPRGSRGGPHDSPVALSALLLSWKALTVLT